MIYTNSFGNPIFEGRMTGTDHHDLKTTFSFSRGIWLIERTIRMQLQGYIESEEHMGVHINGHIMGYHGIMVI